MKKVFQILAGVLFFTSVASAQSTTWNADPAHTNTLFNVQHLGISFVDGEFNKVSGTVVTTSPTSFDNATIDYTIEANSIDTRVEARNNHLKSADFFDVEKYPTLTLKSVSFKKVKGNNYKLIANLTIHGITKQVIFSVTTSGGIITDPWGMTRAGFTASTTINRHDFGLKYNDKLPSGVEAVGSMVHIVVNTEIVHK